MIVLAWIAFGCAVVPGLLYLWNSLLFREPPEFSPSPRFGERVAALRGGVRGGVAQDPSPPTPLPETGRGEQGSPAISVLIPARNEERGIAACIESVLKSREVEIEVIVLDDHSTDRTAEIVREIAARDPRVRVENAPPLPDGWCGKQHACFVLSKLAKHDVITFLDADVRLDFFALARMKLFMDQSEAALVSGFPEQETGTFLEKLLIPLIHWLLLCFLPLWAMRRFRWSALGAGCGQWFMTTRAAYEEVGGHAAVKSSLHDGLTLPRAYRRAGFATDICDASRIATCRMYHSSREVWFGLAKNAREGLASTGQIGFWTVVLFCGQVLPFVFPAYLWLTPRGRTLMVWAFVFALLTHTEIRRRWHHNSFMGFVCFPIGVLLLVAIQWYAIVLAIMGKPVGWKGREHPATSPAYSTS